jgi:hypothetical protein
LDSIGNAYKHAIVFYLALPIRRMANQQTNTKEAFLTSVVRTRESSFLASTSERERKKKERGNRVHLNDK